MAAKKAKRGGHRHHHPCSTCKGERTVYVKHSVPKNLPCGEVEFGAHETCPACGGKGYK